MPPNDVFGAGQVMSVSVEGLAAAQQRMANAARNVQPTNLRGTMLLAAGLVHRFLMSLSASGTSPSAPVLPVVSGRLKNSFFFNAEGRGNDIVGIVASNVDYGPLVDARRHFIARTVRDTERQVNDVFAARLSQL